MNRCMHTLIAALPVVLMPALGLAEDGAHGEHGWDVGAIIASFVNFFVLVSLFIYMGRDKVGAFLKERRAAIEVELNEAARLKSEAEVKHKEYSERLAKLDQELEQIKREMIAAGQKERDRILQEAEEKASRMRKEAEFIIEQQVKQLRSDLMREATGNAVAAAEQLLVKATTSYDQQRIAQEYLASLQKGRSSDAKPHAAPSTQSESLA